MDIDLSKEYHQSSKDGSKGHLPISKNPDDWPELWKVQEYKSYPRFSKMPLPHEKLWADFYTLVTERKSGRDYKEGGIISRSELAALLKYSCGMLHAAANEISSGRAQPSAGGRFPIEMYPFVLTPAKNVPAGVYHYDVRNHQLEVLNQRVFEREDIQKLFRFEWTENASLILVMTAVFGRNQMKYGERGYRYILLEAGHIGQNIHLTATALGLKCCALGGTQDRNIEKVLDIDGVGESVIYAFSVGR